MKINTRSRYAVEDVHLLIVPLVTHAAPAPPISGQIKATEVRQRDGPQHRGAGADDPTSSPAAALR